MSKPQIVHDYDTEWKKIISVLFKDFIQFFLPEMYDVIDFREGAEFMDKEFHQIVKEKNSTSGKGNSYKDKLAKVKLKEKEGEYFYILIHIEIQSSPDPKFRHRMFRYFYRICDSFNWKATAIAIYTGEEVPRNNNKFSYDFYGTKLFYEFNAYKVKAANEEELLASENPFALVILASKYLNATMNDHMQRLAFKIKLIELAAKHHYNAQQIDALLTFIEYLLILPEDLEEGAEGKLKEAYLKSFTSKNMEATKQSKRLVSSLYESIFGESVEGIKQQAAKDKQQAAKDKQQAAKDKQQAAKEREQVEQEKLLLSKNVVNIFVNQGMSLAQIAELLNLPLDEVKKLNSTTD